MIYLIESEEYYKIEYTPFKEDEYRKLQELLNTEGD